MYCNITGRSCVGLICTLALHACGADEHEHELEAFSLSFAAIVDGGEVACTDELQGFGPLEDDRVGLNDLRFYLSNVRFTDAEGGEVDLTLDVNEFQYTSPEGSVALIDLTGNTEGSCSSTSVAYAEGTARTHAALTGTTVIDHVAAVSFDVGVPQAVMKDTIATNTPEGAPSPLNEMYWNWNSGYRHFVLNFNIEDSTDAVGGGYIHVGSRDCAPEGEALALSERDSCTFVNTPAVSLSSFDLATNRIGVDIRAVVDGLDFRSPIYDPDTFEVIGEGPGVECHSSPMQPDCTSVFANFGLDMAEGSANSVANAVFVQL